MRSSRPAIQGARQRVATFVDDQGKGWAVIYVLASIAAVVLFLMLLNMPTGGF